jgi:hypothetical protein
VSLEKDGIQAGRERMEKSMAERGRPLQQSATVAVILFNVRTRGMRRAGILVRERKEGVRVVATMMAACVDG